MLFNLLNHYLNVHASIFLLSINVLTSISYISILLQVNRSHSTTTHPANAVIMVSFNLPWMNLTVQPSYLQQFPICFAINDIFLNSSPEVVTWNQVIMNKVRLFKRYF